MVRLLLVDDHVLFRRGLAALLAARRDIEVIGEAKDGYEAIDQALALRPEVVLMDIQMPLCDGVQATRVIREKLPAAKILILTVSDEDDHLFDAIKAGAHGYLLKNIQPEALTEAISGVVAGEAPISGAVAAKLLREFSTTLPLPFATTDSRLSQREQEILALVARGASNKEIATQLVVTEGTVKNHLHNILSKLHVRNRAEVAAYAVRRGLALPDSTSRENGSKR
ncbi:MAG: response regulator [Chloroflexota bacterium]